MRDQYIVVSPRVEPSDIAHHIDLLDEVNLDYRDLLRFALDHWFVLDDSPDAEVELRAAIETFLTEHPGHYLTNYARLQIQVMMLGGILRHIREGMESQLSPILEPLGLNVQVQFSRAMHNDAVVRITTPPEPQDEL